MNPIDAHFQVFLWGYIIFGVFYLSQSLPTLTGSSKANATKETFVVAKWKVLELFVFSEIVLLNFLLYILKRFLFIFFWFF